MIELQKTVKRLKELRRYYAVKINESGGAWNLVAFPDVMAFTSGISDLIIQVRPFSASIANILSEVQGKLIICNNGGIYYFNPYQFGALGAILDYLSSEDFICNIAKFIITPWPDINEALGKLLLDASNAKVRLDYNKVGVVARELYIMLAQKVYDKNKHIHPQGKSIGNADAKGMLDAYISSEIHEDKLKKHVFSAIELAEPVTHIKEINQKRMRCLVVAVVSVVGLICNIYKGNNN